MDEKAIRPRPATNPALQYFLILYNSVSAVLWGSILGRVLLIAALHGTWRVYIGTGQFVKWTQTLAVLEVVFAATGMVRAPLFTTLMQVASRLLLVWGIVNNFPNETVTSIAYSTMLIAWSVTEVIRYSFFATNLYTEGAVPPTLQWLRYNTFYVLYPLGISSECWLVYSSIPAAGSWYPALPYLLYAVLAVYVPGSYILFTHMMAQRRKIMKGKAPEKTR